MVEAFSRCTEKISVSFFLVSRTSFDERYLIFIIKIVDK